MGDAWRHIGEFSICHATLQEDTDGEHYRVLRWNYDTAEQAWKDLPKVAAEKGLSPDDCVVVHVLAPPPDES